MSLERLHGSMVACLIFSLANLCSCQQPWKLLYEEDFSTPLNESNAQWFLETYKQPFDTILDDAGDWYKNDYVQLLRRH